VTNNLKHKVEDITMELLAERYIGICEENGMFFNNYKNACKEEEVKKRTRGDKRNVIRNRKNKSNR